MIEDNYNMLFIGSEKTSISCIRQIIDYLPENFDFPIFICIPYVQANNINFLNYLSKTNNHIIKYPEHDELIENGKIYIAPPSVHTFISNCGSFHLSKEYTKYYTQPSIDLSLLSFAEYFKDNLTAIIFPCKNKDGIFGLKKLKSCNGKILLFNDNCNYTSYSQILGNEYAFDLENIINSLIQLNQYAEY